MRAFYQNVSSEAVVKQFEQCRMVAYGTLAFLQQFSHPQTLNCCYVQLAIPVSFAATTVSALRGQSTVTWKWTV